MKKTKKLMISEQAFRFLFENDDLSYQETHIKHLLETGDMDNIEIAVQIAKGLNININRIVDELYGLFLNVKQITRGTSFGNKSVENLKALFDINSLDLDNLNLDELPSSIGSLYKLEILSLTMNQLTNLPDTIGNLINLKRLNLKGNKLQTLPKSIKNLQNLERLNLRDNDFSELYIKQLKTMLPNVQIFDDYDQLSY